MKKVVMILLSVTTLLVSCAKQTTITTEQTDLTTEILTQTASGTTEPSEATEPSTEATEPSSEESTEPVDDPEPSEFTDLFRGALQKGSVPVIGEFATIEDAFAGYEMQRMKCEESEWNHFLEKYRDEHPTGHKAAFYLDDRTDVGFLVEVVDLSDDGIKEIMIEELYAFNKLYDVYLEAYYRGEMPYGDSYRTLYATDDTVVLTGYGSVLFIWGNISCSLARRPGNDDPFLYTGWARDGVVRYARSVSAVTAMQSFYDWAKEYWYPGYGGELAAESGTVTFVNGEPVFTPDETYTVEEWLMVYAHMEEKLKKSGYGTLDEYIDAYLYGELNPYKKS